MGPKFIKIFHINLDNRIGLLINLWIRLNWEVNTENNKTRLQSKIEELEKWTERNKMSLKRKKMVTFREKNLGEIYKMGD